MTTPKKSSKPSSETGKTAKTEKTAAKKTAIKTTASAKAPAKKAAAAQMSSKKAPAKKAVAKKTAAKAASKKAAPRKAKVAADETVEQARATEIEAVAAMEAVATAEPAVEDTKIVDPIGDETDGEGRRALGAEDESAAEDEIEDEAEGETEESPKPRPPAKLERLQKILAAAGVASRRSAEAMIEQGRVQVNGKVVTALGTKADAGRDHIRVDGKLLHGAERLRYYILNKPKGFVTTVKDPEGRPTVMQFFEKMKERLYPVGRLDYMSEGLLVVTNDGELANKLTKAASGVEKTYLVKVAGQPTEDELDILRKGVAIERGKPGSAKVRTSPARIRQVRQGDNPWYEVVLIEGRNRELRKMFEEVGHFVEKIRRIGYGPLVLDQEPGNLREMEPGELEQLRLAAEGKLRTLKAKELRRRNLLDAGVLPTVTPKPSNRPRPAQPFSSVPYESRAAAPGAGSGSEQTGGFRPRKTFGADRIAGRPDARPGARPAWKKDDRNARPPARFNAGSAATGRPAAKPFAPDRPESARPAFDRPRFDRPGFDRPRSDRPRTDAAQSASAGMGRTGAGRPFTAKPAWQRPERPERSARPEFQRPAPPRREAPARAFQDFDDDDLGPVRPPNLHIEEIPHTDRGSQSRPASARPGQARSSAPRNFSPRSGENRTHADRTGAPRSGAPRPFRGEGGSDRALPRPFTTSSGKPRPGGARPSSKPGKSGPARPGQNRPFGGQKPFGGKPGSSRPFAPRSAALRPNVPGMEAASDYRPTKAKPFPSSSTRAERKAGSEWKPKPSFGGKGKPGSGSFSRPKPGGAGYKGKPAGGGVKRGGPRPGGSRPGGKPGGKPGGRTRGY